MCSDETDDECDSAATGESDLLEELRLFLSDVERSLHGTLIHILGVLAGRFEFSDKHLLLGFRWDVHHFLSFVK
jgi:hypothetical protein